MTNEELKKKITDVLFITGQSNDKYSDGKRFIVDEEMADKLADALIAAGICDMSELEAKREELRLASEYYANEMHGAEKRIKRAERRAEIAEKALCNALNDDSCYFCNKKSPCECEHRDWGSKECITVLLRQAEKELAEGKDD